MDEKYYTNERNVQIVLSLLKKYNIHRVIVSPGTTNITLVGSMQYDTFFEMYSAADERSAAYMACGLAEETGEPVVLSCTGATASRNYIPGLTEAFYRKLPVVAITSTHDTMRIGHLQPQVIDRSSFPNDIVRKSVQLPMIKDEEEAWNCMVCVNMALQELQRNGGGPVHLNLATGYNSDFSVMQLPEVRKIEKVCLNNSFPTLPKGKIGIYVGAHSKWTQEETAVVDQFCAEHDAVVFCDHTSNYKGRYRLLYSLVQSQELFHSDTNQVNLLIHIGEISGSYVAPVCEEVWRISEDGEIRDTFCKLTHIFEMKEADFFRCYITGKEITKNDYLRKCQSVYNYVYQSISENNLPFSNIWAAYKLAPLLPADTVLHLGILNSLRSWNFFEIPESVLSYSNVGGFGIDGGLSSLVGASLARPDKLYFGVIGDLAFFYDMNVLGNRHIGKNLRLLLINNGKGTEFKMYNHPAFAFGESADNYIAACGHYGNQSRNLIKHYTEDLGFEYISASGKAEFEKNYMRFITPDLTDKPMLFEIFTDNVSESEALKCIRNSVESPLTMKEQLKKNVKHILGKKGIRIVKGILRK